MTKYFKCFSARLASKLIKSGFKPVRTEPNMKKPQYDVFVFEDSEELRTIVNAYCQQ